MSTTCSSLNMGQVPTEEEDVTPPTEADISAMINGNNENVTNLLRRAIRLLERGQAGKAAVLCQGLGPAQVHKDYEAAKKLLDESDVDGAAPPTEDEAACMDRLMEHIPLWFYSENISRLSSIEPKEMLAMAVVYAALDNCQRFGVDILGEFGECDVIIY
jgi:hypothetical protein